MNHARRLCSYLRVDSEAHNVVLTEPALNTPEAREAAAEVLFESFAVPGLHIGSQAVFALYAAFGQQARMHAALYRCLLYNQVHLWGWSVLSRTVACRPSLHACIVRLVARMLAALIEGPC